MPVAVSLVVVLVSAPRLDQPFGPEFEGFNTAVWASGARAVRTDGWWEARLGARTERVGYPEAYAHHPPLTQVLASGAGTTVGDERWAYRLAALMCAVAAVWCCWGWLGACGFGPAARSVGVLLAGGTPLIARYGVMLNMETTWLPFLFGLLWAWQRAAGDPRNRRAAAWCVALAVAGSLAAHQGILLAGLLGLVGVARACSQRRRPFPYETGTLAGAAVGAVLFLGWATWAGGGLSELRRIAGVRAGSRGWWDWAVVQHQHLVPLFGGLGVAALLVGGAVLVRRRRDLLQVAAVVAVVTVVYAAAFRDGSWHVYWNAGLLALVALGGALVAERAERSTLPVVPLLMALAALPYLAAGRAAAEAGPSPYAIAVTAAGRAQETVFGTEVLGQWATYESSRPVASVPTCGTVGDLAATAPGALVVTSAGWVRSRAGDAGWSAAVGAASSRVGDVVVVRAADLRAAAC